MTTLTEETIRVSDDGNYGDFLITLPVTKWPIRCHSTWSTDPGPTVFHHHNVERRDIIILHPSNGDAIYWDHEGFFYRFRAGDVTVYKIGTCDKVPEDYD